MMGGRVLPVAQICPTRRFAVTDLAISARSFSKTFSGRTVLRDVDLDVAPGEIHGLLGQNGSGKSTFIKILSGYHGPDDGASLEVAGKTVGLPLRPGVPRQLGMAFVHQDLGLAETMTVLENLRVGRFQLTPAGNIRWRAERRVVAAGLARFAIDASPDTLLGDLRPVDRAQIAILRAVTELEESNGSFLVLDEPTAYLPKDGVDRLFASVREAAAHGVGILFVSHRLDEVREITDRVSILRDGLLVETAETASLSERDLIDRILGRPLEQLYPAPHTPRPDIVLRADGLAGEGVQDFSFELARGEVVGLTGLLGMGYDRVPYLLYGAEKATRGTVAIRERTVAAALLSPRKALALGIALLPANRMQDGGVMVATVAENATLPTLERHVVAGWLSHRREVRHVAGLLDRFEVNPRRPDMPLGSLSGGNQQKVLVGKWFDTGPAVLLLHEPTQGVDVGAKAAIFQHIRNAAESGIGVVIASSEYEDLAHLCDRVMVFRSGRAASILHGASLTQERIVEQCFTTEPSETPAGADSKELTE